MDNGSSRPFTVIADLQYPLNAIATHPQDTMAQNRRETGSEPTRCEGV